MSESVRIGTPPSAPPASPKRRWPLFTAIGVAVAAIAVSAAVAGIMAARADYAAAIPSPTSTSTLGATMNVRGGIVLAAGDYAVKDKQCFGKGGMDDVAPGAQVKVTDRSGTLVGLGSITSGVVTDSDSGNARNVCLMFWTVDNVPRFQQFYGVEVAHRGIVQATEDELIGGEFTLSLE